MALTNSQVQQVYLAITGRPAEGNAVTWASSANSVADLANAVIDIRKNSDFTSNEQFVNHLYQYLLNDTAPDAEGVAYWTGLLKGSKAEDGTEIPAISKAELIEQFINAVLAQNQTDHKYTLEAKTQIAVDFGNDVKSFVGGKAAEADLRDKIFSHVDKNTTYADIEEDATNFKGQYVNVASVTVQQGAEEATEGSETNATNYNATLDLAGDGEIQINGATDYSDTLNLKVTGDTDNQDLLGSHFNSINTVSNVNIDMNNAKAAAVTLATSEIQGVKNLTIKGSSIDKITVDTALTSLDTGAGADTITLNKVVGSVKAGAGNDVIKIVAAANSASSTIDGGAGTDTLHITNDVAKVSLSNIEVLAGTGKMSTSQLSGKSYTIGAEIDGAYVSGGITVDNVGSSGINLGKVKAAEGKTDSTIALKLVKGGIVTLSQSDDTSYIKETVELAKTAKNVKINDFQSKSTAIDKLNIEGVTAATASAMSAAVAKDKVYLTTSDKNLVNSGKLSTDGAALFTGTNTGLDVGDTLYVAQAATDSKKTLIYKITNVTGTSIGTDDSINLVATVNGVELLASDFA